MERYEFNGEDLRVNNINGDWVKYADHRREVEGLIKERDAYKAVLVGGEYENVERLEQQSIELCTVVGQAAATRTKELVQQVAQLTAERDEAIKDQYMIIPQSGDTPVSWEEAFNDTQHDLTTLRGLVEAFIEAWDHDGEPNAAAYEDTVAKARATLAQPNVSTSIIGKQLPPPQWDKNAEVRGDIS